MWVYLNHKNRLQGKEYYRAFYNKCINLWRKYSHFKYVCIWYENLPNGKKNQWINYFYGYIFKNQMKKLNNSKWNTTGYCEKNSCWLRRNHSWTVGVFVIIENPVKGISSTGKIIKTIGLSWYGWKVTQHHHRF